MQGRFLRQVINKFMTNSEVANNARVQVYMPNGDTLQKALGPLSIKLYEGSKILELHKREPCACIAEGWTKVQEHLVNVT
jgi:hypothetical protein